ncbi:hypothetical protein HUF15_00620 [Streptomyces samsunensis]|uniref:hypothetical protein n=1 Tax=Streptomyces malaysiensis TaxID=92644 RepID=UPI0015837915|nr:hypothetical protein [Streptomyces samsunensis]NUH35284.1 hypothetical protein [Streptomyces samsunensis]
MKGSETAPPQGARREGHAPAAPAPAPGAHSAIDFGVTRRHSSSHPADQLRSELAYQLGRVYSRYPLTPTALSAAWERAITRTLPGHAASVAGPVIAQVVLSMPRPSAEATCGQYAALLRATPAVTA